jgi:hypothetical protein
MNVRLLGFHKEREVSWLAECLLVFQEEVGFVFTILECRWKYAAEVRLLQQKLNSYFLPSLSLLKHFQNKFNIIEFSLVGQGKRHRENKTTYDLFLIKSFVALSSVDSPGATQFATADVPLLPLRRFCLFAFYCPFCSSMFI